MITLKQIQRAQRMGEKFVYFSAGTMWWTHTEKDVSNATIRGRKYFQDVILKKVNDGTISENDRLSLMELRESFSNNLPVDPLGFPVKKMDLKLWLDNSLSNPSHYGKHGLTAFLFTHHQNCKSFFSNKWDSYNNYIDKLWKTQ